jgi:hypothetical protein
MLYEVVSIEQDIAGKWYARIITAVDELENPTETQFFKFDHEPTEDDIQLVIDQLKLLKPEETPDAVTE